ncbi:MAG: protein kinase, partial [Acidobacteria bacterium]|nr:protein kinase [Acidobacteriota bacterium]
MSMGIEGERRAEIDRLFEQALGLNGEDRASFLDALREQDRELAEAVEELLALGGEEDERLRPTRILGGPLWSELAGEAPPLPAGLRDGETLGPYQVLRELGRGGMAVVYLARRADGAFDQQVALKLLRPGAVAEDSLRRFEQERQILAGLAHPAIARLLDGGVDEKGRPFIALEHVEGKPIDAYCNEHRLSLEDRLKLFRSVAEAVSYAHEQGVIHRDLKPS